MSTSLILASSSPRRRELLTRVGIALEIVPADVDESVLAGEEALAYGVRVAAAKAERVAAQMPERWVLAADTVVEIDGEILGKAGDEDEARAMLTRLLGRPHRVSTSFCLRGPGAPPMARTVTTEVLMRAAEPGEIDAYVAAGEWRGKAGAYAIQGMAAGLVREVRGSVTNVIGLPLAEVLEALAHAGAAAPDYALGVAE
ncbi:Maf family protein [Haliangium ochraceum]|uniref:dTTP/UTP pyrophosphatase n=1 Tax=Haliangium ochraceum (strain DSM 14365 / JCM 11303 / SMP-2) TaxID=502025 RepID=D0LZF0_HALO1|nr:Maf family protein [Haliangium ochraceum]ACY16412.1 maf protein [Haliangium ochraceum DSM 14365]